MNNTLLSCFGAMSAMTFYSSPFPVAKLSLYSACSSGGKIAFGRWGSIQLFRERLSYKRGKAYATMSKAIMGNGRFCGCLSEPQGVSAWWKEAAQTCIRFFSFLVAESP